MSRLWGLAPFALLGVLLVLPFYLTPYWNGRLVLIFVFALAILGLNLIAGYTGQLSVAQSFFLGIGAYTAAYLVTKVEIPALLTIPVAGLVGFAAAAVLAVPVLRLRGFYLMVITLAVLFTLSPLLKRFPDQTGGSAGLSVTPPEPRFGLFDDQWIYLVCLVVVAALFWVGLQLVRSPYGLAMVAVREQELVARSVGIAASRLKLKIFALAGLYAGVAGSLYALAIGYVSPDSFGLHMGLAIFAGAFMGGISSVYGALLGAMFVQLVPQFASQVDASMTGVIYGAAVIVCGIFIPGGIAGLGRQLSARGAAWRSQRPRVHPTINDRESSMIHTLESSPTKEST